MVALELQAVTPEEQVIRELSASLSAILAMGGGEKRRGHAPACAEGYWLGRGVEPHSARCLAAQHALDQAEAWLATHAMRQEALFR